MTGLPRQLGLQAAGLLAVLAACAVRQEATLAACPNPADAAALQDCLDRTPEGGRLALPPGRITLTVPVVLHRRVTLTTAGLAPDAPRCAEDGAGCATLVLRTPASPQPPLTVAADGSVLDHIAIEGSRAEPGRAEPGRAEPGRAEPGRDAAACAGPNRPSAGGLLITGRRVTITHSVLRDAACHSAAVASEAAAGLRFTDNAVLANGTHAHGMWADGLTVLDGVDDVIRGNLFRDNTDVQLVLGGCLRCTVATNRIESTDAPAFAGLLLHGWPHTSGDYAGTAITANTVDCGPARQCGFGIAVGGQAWYPGPASGGTVTGNTVTRAAIGINVDGATGPVTMRDNAVTLSGGPVRSHCGVWFAGPVNISAASRRFVDATAGVAMAAEGVTAHSFAGCLPGT